MFRSTFETSAFVTGSLILLGLLSYAGAITA
jgi:hypothetical protein